MTRGPSRASGRQWRVGAAALLLVAGSAAGVSCAKASATIDADPAAAVIDLGGPPVPDFDPSEIDPANYPGQGVGDAPPEFFAYPDD